MDDSKALARGKMAIAKDEIDALKDKRHKLCLKLCDALANVVQDRTGHIADYDAHLFDDLARKFHETQCALMTQTHEYNRQAERAEKPLILVRRVAFI